MRLKTGVVAFTIVFGARDAEHLGKVLNDPLFQNNLKELLSMHGLTMLGDAVGNGVMSGGFVEIDESRIISPH